MTLPEILVGAAHVDQVVAFFRLHFQHFRQQGAQAEIGVGGAVLRGRDLRGVGGELLVRFVEPLDAAAVHQPDILVAVHLEQPEGIGSEPVVVVAVEDHGVAGRNASVAHQLFKFLLADDVAADLILKLALPVEAD